MRPFSPPSTRPAAAAPSGASLRGRPWHNERLALTALFGPPHGRLAQGEITTLTLSGPGDRNTHRPPRSKVRARSGHAACLGSRGLFRELGEPLGVNSKFRNVTQRGRAQPSHARVAARLRGAASRVAHADGPAAQAMGGKGRAGAPGRHSSRPYDRGLGTAREVSVHRSRTRDMSKPSTQDLRRQGLQAVSYTHLT